MFNYEQSLYILYLIEINKQISHVYFLLFIATCSSRTQYIDKKYALATVRS